MSARRLLKCETYTPEMAKRVELAAAGVLDMDVDLTVTFEHGQWWVTCGPCGAQWSVHDSDVGFGFEQVSSGDGYHPEHE
jgi:hypothetical protein